ncbi:MULTISPECIES: hypothetical protein [unclassified Myroides]|uniref:hypothetical protein n=1 Tax=unclassified Myroides TaxID=2642485 RepID=UPI003D2F9423
MKRKLLVIGVLLLATTTYSQVGIGTTIPNKSAELTMVSKDKGLLIPNIALKSTTDQTTIVNGNIESLLVYANKAQGDVVPGFYYWNTGEKKWLRIVPDVDVTSTVINNFKEIITNETVIEEIQQIFQTVGGNVYYDGTSFTYTNEAGVKVPLDIEAFIRAHETITTMVKDPSSNGKYTYKNEAGVSVVIDVPADVINSFEEIIANTTVQEILNQYIITIGGNVYYDGEILEYVDSEGERHEVNLTNVVRNRETVTKLVNNNNGTLTYYNEKEIDSSGIPIPHTGTTFNIPKPETYDLTSVVLLSQGLFSSKSWTYDRMVAQSTGSSNFITNATFEPIFTVYFPIVSNKPASTKYLNLEMSIVGHVTTIGTYLANV